jgi:hypothetical protein
MYKMHSKVRFSFTKEKNSKPTENKVLETLFTFQHCVLLPIHIHVG